jgi:hypothetical protein
MSFDSDKRYFTLTIDKPPRTLVALSDARHVNYDYCSTKRKNYELKTWKYVCSYF